MEKDILRRLESLNAGALFLEPRGVYDPALVGVTDNPDDSWPRETNAYVAVYDSGKCIEAIMAWLACDYADATDWFYFNTSGAWVGEGTPTFRSESPQYASP